MVWEDACDSTFESDDRVIGCIVLFGGVMDSVILSFLCGAAFIGGAMAVLVCVAVIVQLKDSKGRQEVQEHWDRYFELMSQQVGTLMRIEEAIRQRES
jgi:hypothetical protein